MAVEKNRIRIWFDNAEGGLMSKGKEVTEFQIAGEDRKFVPARQKSLAARWWYLPGK
jgi:sialate O-acetylesterase